eukprot:gene15624-21117_t
MLSKVSKRKRNPVDQSEQFIRIDAAPCHQEVMLDAIRKLYEEKKLCDVEFQVDGNKFYAHRVVLAASSSFFSAMILCGLQESSLNIIPLDGDPILFRYVLDYMYGLPIDITPSLVIPLLGVSNCYSMIGLRDKLAELLGRKLSIDNCCSIFAAADEFGCDQLKLQSETIIFTNFAFVSKTEGFLELYQSSIEYILSSDEILDCDEAILFDAAVRWLDFKSSEREEACLSLLKLVRFPLMDSCLLSDVIKKHRLMIGIERSNLLMEAFEHHALRATGRFGLDTPRTKSRKQSCSFTRSTLLNGHNDAVSALVCCGEWLISGSWDSSIKVWATDTWLCVRTLSDHTGSVRGLCVCQDKIVSCSDDGVIKVWSPGTWTCVRSMEGHDGAANALLQCRGRLASAGDDGTIKLWGANSWTCEVTVHHARLERAQEGDADDEEGAINHVGVMSMEVCDDKLISGGDDFVIRIWNTNNWTCERVLIAHQDEVWTIKMNCDGSLVTGSVDGTIRVWRRNLSKNNITMMASTTTSSSSTPHHTKRMRNSSVSPNTMRNSNGSNSNNSMNGNGSIDEWECEHTVVSDGPIYSICCLIDGRVVSAGAGNQISVWKREREHIEEEEWKLHSSFETEEAGIWSLIICKGRLISGGVDGTVRVWT